MIAHDVDIVLSIRARILVLPIVNHNDVSGRHAACNPFTRSGSRRRNSSVPHSISTLQSCTHSVELVICRFSHIMGAECPSRRVPARRFGCDRRRVALPHLAGTLKSSARCANERDPEPVVHLRLTIAAVSSVI